jgi:curved DNA-binding protein CbpA
MSGLLDFIYDLETFVDLYGVLEVEMDATSDEIKIAYIKMAKKHHPDQGGSSDKFQEITRAYEILFNKETRKEYDLYYLKKSMDEFKSDDIKRLKDDFKNFVSTNTNTKPISKEELDKLYSETFEEHRELNKNISIGADELKDKINDINVERQNMLIETSDNTLTNFLSQHKDLVNINDVFEFIKYKNTQSFSNSIMTKEWGTLDTISGYSNGYSSFMDENEYFGSNLYSDISDMNSTQATDITNNINIDDFIQWKSTKRSDSKLTNDDIDDYLKRRQEEQDNIFKEVEKNLEPSSKVKETEKFLKTKHLKENINEYYNNLDKSSANSEIKKNTKSVIKKSNIPEIIDLNLNLNSNSSNNDNSYTHANSSDINGILKFMDEINHTNKQDFEELEKEISLDKLEKKPDEFIELKSGVEVPKTNNVRKREFK